ncbi:MAG TPA: ABC transporter ATP-binding protein [Chlamydiales bacterium]|nr:ABC transporter ATP-binding protein [Chlamydiales bacterium]
MSELLRVRNLSKIYSVGKRTLKAVDTVNFSIERGETLGLVGESGCGKSTLGRMLLGLIPQSSGQIFFDGEEVGLKRDRSLYRRMQMIFQDPFASLNPRMSVGEILNEPLKIHGLKREIDELLDLVGLPRQAKSRYPHEFSGGQRQRIGIARALALNPEFIVCDEPISALDVSIQAQIVNLLLRLQKELHLTYLFIAHDLAMVKYLSTRVAVMYLGKFVEIGPTEQVYSNPLHPYTQVLLSSVPLSDPIQERKRTAIPLQGEPPSPLNPPKGCAFCTRCPNALPQCHRETPRLRELKSGHQVACHLAENLLNKNRTSMDLSLISPIRQTIV